MKKLHTQTDTTPANTWYTQYMENKGPDPKKHQLVSFIKSAVRIVGYFITPFSLPLAAGVLILSEAIGIIEELV